MQLTFSIPIEINKLPKLTHLFALPDVLCAEAQSTAPLTTVPTVSFSGTDVPVVLLTPDGKPQQNKGTLNVCERNGTLLFYNENLVYQAGS